MGIFANSAIDAFFRILRAGLWDEEVRHFPYDHFEITEVLHLAREQSVVGLIAAGIDNLKDVHIRNEEIFTIIGLTLQLERRNNEMNCFISRLVDLMSNAGISSVLVKGQGIAQCYERPLLRMPGDVDLLFDYGNYLRAVPFFRTMASRVENERPYDLHLGMYIDSWEVELHGSFRSGLWRRMDQVIDNIQKETFKGSVRVWHNGGTDVILPSPDNDAVFIFSHILQHFFRGGIGVRQICDWCRLLWRYRDSIDRTQLESRVLSMKIMTEWRAFAAMSVRYLGMPESAMPFYSSATKWKRKSDQIVKIVLRDGNFGHNHDNSYQQRYPPYLRKLISLCRITVYCSRDFLIFPVDSMRVWSKLFINGMKRII